MPLKVKTELLRYPRTLPAVVSTIFLGSVDTTGDRAGGASSSAPAEMLGYSEAIPAKGAPSEEGVTPADWPRGRFGVRVHGALLHFASHAAPPLSIE
jgi:hypothetical protein